MYMLCYIVFAISKLKWMWVGDKSDNYLVNGMNEYEYKVCLEILAAQKKTSALDSVAVIHEICCCI